MKIKIPKRQWRHYLHALHNRLTNTPGKKKKKNLEIKKYANQVLIFISRSCPFTIQRLCELVIEPKKYYKMYIKYLRAVEKVLSVTSYWEEYVNSNDSGTGDKATLLPTFSVEVEPHNFSTATTPAGEESAMEDVDNTVVESKVEQVTKEEDVMEDITKEEVSKEEADVPKTETKPDDDAKMDLD